MSSQVTETTKAGDTQVLFYKLKNLGGTPEGYNVGDDVNLYPGNLNDRFLSSDVGRLAKVLAWRHSNGSGEYRELTGQNPDISDIGGLSRFKVLSHNTRVISFKFKDATGGEAKQYSLLLKAADVGEMVLYSNEDDEFKLVGTMPEGGPPVTTAIYVRDQHTGVYIATGSIFFQWNRDTKQVDIVSNENFPVQLKQERVDASRFVITLVSNQPT